MTAGAVSSDPAADPLPAWPTPQWTAVDSPEALATMLDSLRADAPAAVGLSVSAVGPAGVRDPAPRDQTPVSIALAHGGSADASGQGPTVWVIDPNTVAELGPLRSWLGAASAPYVVMHGSQSTLHALAAPDAAPDQVWSPKRIGDTRIAAHLLAAAAGTGRAELDLTECVARALHHQLGPGVARRGRPAGGDLFAPDVHAATALSASALIPLMRTLTPMLRKATLTRPYELESALVPAVVAMERTGFGIDAAAFQRIADSWGRERKDNPAPERIARLDKLLSTYAHWPRDFARRGRIHCRLHPLAAESGRFSCTDPNLQQVPGSHTAPGLRACFVPPADHRLIVADYAQIELRVAAHMAPCPALRAVFAEGRDPHRTTAATITGKSEAEISTRERKLAKAVNFGFLFGMGARRFASYARDSYGVEVSDAEAKRARQAFFDTFPGISAWHRRVGDLERGNAVTVRTALGRRKRFAADRFSFNAALNIPVQGTAAEGFKRAMIQLHERLPEVGGRGVLVVHDEYIAEVPAARADQARLLVQAVMESAMAEVVTSVPVQVEARVTEHWA